MIKSLYNLGIALRDEPRYADYFASYANPFPKKNPKGEDIVWCFLIEKDEVRGLEKGLFRPQDLDKYLYRKPKGARGAPLVATGPTYPVTDPQNPDKRAKHLENVDKLMSRIERSIPPGRSSYFSNNGAREKGLARVREILENEAGTTGNRYLYTFKVDGKWLGEIPELVELLDNEAYAKYYEKSKAKGKTCALTHEENVEVWGRVDTLGFTVNDKAFNRGGFDGKSSYRMFPVSSKAVLALEGAKRYAFQHLAARFYTLEYLVIPRSIEGHPKLLLPAIKVLSKLEKKQKFEEQGQSLLGTSRKLDRIAEQEELQRSGMLFDLLFFHRNQAQLALDLLIQDITPGRILQIKDAQRRVNDFYGYGFGRKDGNQEHKHLSVSIGTLRSFFSEGTGTKLRFHPFFYRILEGIFQGETISEPTFLAGLMDRIRETFKHRQENNFFPGQVLRAIMLWQFLAAAGLFDNKNPLSMETERKEVVMNYEEFLSQHDNFYDRPPLRGAFLLGILTGMLTYAQYKAINSKPFLNRVNNLKLGKEELIKLSTELLDKIHQYQQRSTTKSLLPYTIVNQLFAEANTALVAEGKASRDELSFAFASGLVIQQQHGISKGQKKSEPENTEVHLE